MTYLYNSREISQQLTQLFTGDGEKWAIVGFVGYDAVDLLPKDVKNLSVVCWPKAGGTNPDGIRRLIQNGITVYFCDRLHHKTYWCKGVGLIVGSANLSKNALGEAGLHEFGVYCEDENFDIKQVLDALRYREVTTAELAKLDVEYARQARQQEFEQVYKVPSFIEAMQMPHPRQWKLISCIGEIDTGIIDVEVKTHFGETKWKNYNEINQATIQVGDFIYQVKTDENDEVVRANGRWLFVDHIIKQKGKYHIAVQVYKLNEHITPPPFVIDSDFKKALKQAMNNEEWDNIYDDNYTVKSEFIQAIKDYYPD
ncbi:MAG: phospholipase D family protein [Methylococcales bacterium]|nr:phospholipase D family protein [Methylococcales bacterium]